MILVIDAFTLIFFLYKKIYQNCFTWCMSMSVGVGLLLWNEIRRSRSKSQFAR